MKKIGDLFEKYRRTLKPPQASVERTAAEVIAKVTTINIKAEYVSYTPSTRTLAINGPSIIKTEVQKNKQVILTELAKQLGEANTPTNLL